MKRMPNRELQETVVVGRHVGESAEDPAEAVRIVAAEHAGDFRKIVAAPPDEPLGLLNLGAVKG